MASRTRAEKAFDCLAYKRRVQCEIYEEIKGLDFQEERAYFQRRAEEGPLGQWWKRIKAAGQTEVEDR